MDIAGFPYFEVEFNKAAELVDQHEAEALLGFLNPHEATDVLVISHGWNNDMGEARELYRRFFTALRDELPVDGDHRLFVVVGVLWPSKKFADSSVIAGGAAGENSWGDTVLQTHIDKLKGGFDAPDADKNLEKAKSLLSALESSAAQQEFVQLIRACLPNAEKEQDVDGTSVFFEEDAETLLQKFARPVPVKSRRETEEDVGAAAGFAGTEAQESEGVAAGLLDFLGGVQGAALNMLNYATYYQMKERAGHVGAGGLYPLLLQVRAESPAVRIHLIGHSFGSRLVTAAVGPAGFQRIADSLTLLQGAFSHHGFAEKFDGSRDGFFRHVVSENRVNGPIVITYTRNDTAVGKLYPLASMLAGQDAAGLGGPDDRFGGIGSNGAVKTPEAIAEELLSPNAKYRLIPGKVHNLLADAFIKDHSDICGREVVHAVAASVGQP